MYDSGVAKSISPAVASPVTSRAVSISRTSTPRRGIRAATVRWYRPLALNRNGPRVRRPARRFPFVFEARK